MMLYIIKSMAKKNQIEISADTQRLVDSCNDLMKSDAVHLEQVNDFLRNCRLDVIDYKASEDKGYPETALAISALDDRMATFRPQATALMLSLVAFVLSVFQLSKGEHWVLILVLSLLSIGIFISVIILMNLLQSSNSVSKSVELILMHRKEEVN